MKAISLFKLQSLVVVVLCTSQFAFGETKPTSDKNLTTVTDPPAKNVSTVGGRDSLVDLLTRGVSADSNKCESQASRLDSLNSSRSTLQTQALQTQFESESKTLDFKQTAQKVALSQAEAADIYQATTSAIANELMINKQKIQAGVAQKLAELRGKALEMQKGANEAKASLRAAANAIDDVKNDQEVTCRTAAEAAGNAMEAKIEKKYDDKMNAIQSGAAYENNAGATLSGATNRRKARRVVNIQNAYLTAYKNCMAGTSGAGATAAANEKKARSQLALAEQKFNDDMALLEKAQTELKIEMDQQVKNGAISLDEAQAAASQKLDGAKIAFNKANNGAALEIQHLGEKYQLANSQNMRLVQQTNQQLYNAGMGIAQATYSMDSCMAKANQGNPDLAALLKKECNGEKLSFTDPSSGRSISCPDDSDSRLPTAVPAAPVPAAQPSVG